MSFTLPPPPLGAEPGDFAWSSWQTSLYRSIAQPGSILWVSVDKSGSSLADLANKGHHLLTSVMGTGSSHLSVAEGARVTATMTVTSASADPTTTAIAAGNWAIYKNTTSGVLKLWSNDGGVMKGVALV